MRYTCCDLLQIADLYFQLHIGGQSFFARPDALKVSACVYMCSTSYDPCSGISEGHVT